MSKILQEVLSANQKYAADFGDKAKLAMPRTGTRVAINNPTKNSQIAFRICVNSSKRALWTQVFPSKTEVSKGLPKI